MSKGVTWPKRRHIFRGIGSCCVTIVIIILLIILIVYLSLRPTKPQFYLQTVHLIKILNSPATSAPPTLTTNLQVTISSRNPNNRIGIYYDKLDTYATYRDQPVTAPVMLPPIYEGHKDVAVWSPVLVGNNVPIDQYTASAIQQDQSSGVILFNVKIDGRVRWKVGSWTSGHYHLFVNCPILVSLNGGMGAGMGATSLSGDGMSPIVECHVED
ncbi:hypothetical protein LUZ60_004174 [Juncus effusus]|nr:hypothetical protein LUZ60_004174 [Juncus effusus]